MSIKGIKKTAKIFSDMQMLRCELLKDINDKQDILLGQMLETGKEAMVKKFIKITAKKW